MLVTEFFDCNNRTTFFSDSNADAAWCYFWQACKDGARTVEFIREGEVIAAFTRPTAGGTRFIG